ncbi:alpha/beta fold hydrolase [Mycobacterium sp. C31M]
MLEVRRYGAHGGFPVLLHHGLVGCARASAEAAEAAAVGGIELLAVARPGYGRSAPVAMTSVSDWNDLVAPVLDGIGRYGVWAVSAGAPYAYALAAADPERVSAVAVTSGLGHVADEQVRNLYGPESQALFTFFRTGDPGEVCRYWYEALQTTLADAPPDGDWAGALRDSVLHNGAGPGREAILQQHPWGFDFVNITAPVRLWHSGADSMVPVATARAICELIPGAVLSIQDSAEHVPTPAVVTEALGFLAATA